MIEAQEAENVLEQKKRGVGRPKKADDDQGVRVTVTLPKSLTDTIEEFIRGSHHSSVTEYVKSALLFYSMAVDNHMKGGKAILKDEQGNDMILPVAFTARSF